MVIPLDKDDLYKKTKWFSKDCEDLVHNLEKFGLVICEKKNIDENNLFCKLSEDDLK